MWTALFARRRQLHGGAPLDAESATDDEEASADVSVLSGWHESSWALARGVEVMELPATASSRWFADA